MTAAVADPLPMSEMNTTPLIDVMLVLLIMVITTMPLQSHAVKLDLPSGDVPEVNLFKNKLIITHDDQLLWNGEAINRDQLKLALAEVAQSPARPELQLQPEATANYALVDEVLADTKRAQVTRMGFVGNESYARF